MNSHKNESIERKIEITPTPQELSLCFMKLDSIQMAEFYNAMADIIQEWDYKAGSFAMQMQYLIDEKGLTDEAKHMMDTMSEYFKYN